MKPLVNSFREKANRMLGDVITTGSYPASLNNSPVVNSFREKANRAGRHLEKKEKDLETLKDQIESLSREKDMDSTAVETVITMMDGFEMASQIIFDAAIENGNFFPFDIVKRSYGRPYPDIVKSIASFSPMLIHISGDMYCAAYNHHSAADVDDVFFARLWVKYGGKFIDVNTDDVPKSVMAMTEGVGETSAFIIIKHNSGIRLIRRVDEDEVGDIDGVWKKEELMERGISPSDFMNKVVTSKYQKDWNFEDLLHPFSDTKGIEIDGFIVFLKEVTDRADILLNILNYKNWHLVGDAKHILTILKEDHPELVDVLDVGTPIKLSKVLSSSSDPRITSKSGKGHKKTWFIRPSIDPLPAM